MKSVLLVPGLCAVFATPVLAGTCDTDLPALKSQLSQSSAQADVTSQVQDMVAQAEKLCAAGNEDEAADVIADATAMLAR